MSTNLTASEAEPTPEFNTRCVDVHNRWQSGELPFKDALELMHQLGSEAETARQWANLGRVELLLGVMQGYRANLDASIRHFERARELFETVGNRKRAVGAILNLGESYRLKGNFPRARQLFRAAHEAAEQMSMINTQAIAACNEGLMLISMNHIDGARFTLEKAYRLAERIIDDPTQRMELLCDIQSGLATVFVRMGDVEQAWSHAVNALAFAGELAHPLAQGMANRAMGEVMSAIEAKQLTFDMEGLERDPDEYFRIATEAFRELKAEGEVARSMYTHALSLGERGRSMMAARKLQQAMLIFTRLGMTDDAAKAAQAQMHVLSGSSH